MAKSTITNPKKAPVVALLTDFGLSDWYVGAVKAVLSHCKIPFHCVDISHSINPGDIHQADFVLANVYENFPKGTIFVVVVDPGVGTERQPLCIKTEDYFFIGPDNGVFTRVLKKAQKKELRKIKAVKNNISQTFHGRDIFAPAALSLLKGKSFSSLGGLVSNTVELKQQGPIFRQKKIEAEIIYIDSFGNCISNLKLDSNKQWKIAQASCRAKNFPFKNTYGEVAINKNLSLWGSSGYLEVAVHQGSAAAKYKINRGDKVQVFLG